MAAPTVTALSPSYGTGAGGTSVTITGTGFTGATAVHFGSTDATSYTVVGATSITAVAPAATPGLAYVYVTNADGTSTASLQFEAVGLFSLSDARSYDKGQLAHTETYSDATIIAQEAAIREKFERAIGVSFLPTTPTEYYDGDGSDTLYLAHHNPWSEQTPRAVTLISITVIAADDTETAFTAAELADVVKYPHKLVRRSGVFTEGNRNIKVVYTHGYTTVPVDIKYVGQQALLLPPPDGLVPSNVPSMVIDGSDGQINWSRVKDPARGRWYGSEAIDPVLREYRDRETLPGVI